MCVFFLQITLKCGILIFIFIHRILNKNIRNRQIQFRENHIFQYWLFRHQNLQVLNKSRDIIKNAQI